KKRVAYVRHQQWDRDVGAAGAIDVTVPQTTRRMKPVEAAALAQAVEVLLAYEMKTDGCSIAVARGGQDDSEVSRKRNGSERFIGNLRSRIEVRPLHVAALTKAHANDGRHATHQ